MTAWLGCWLLSVAAMTIGPQGVVVERILAVVNGEIITLSDVRTVRILKLGMVEEPTDKARVDLLVERQLVLAELKRYAPAEPSPEDVAARRKVWAATHAGGDPAPALTQAGVSEAFVVGWLRDDLRREAYLTQRFSTVAIPTRDEVQQYFQDHQTDFTRGGVTLEFAVVEAEVRAKVTADRLARFVRQWIDGLRLRAEIAIR